MMTGLRAFVTSLSVYVVKQAAVTVVPQIGIVSFAAPVQVNTTLDDDAFAANPVGGLKAMDGTATFTMAGAEWTASPLLPLALATRS